MRVRSSQGLWLFATALFAVACGQPDPLTEAKAKQIIASYEVRREPVYAAVPQKVWWDERHPKDDFDDKSVRTLQNLANGGYITIEHPNDSTYIAKVTPKGFPLLGTSPSARGPVYKAMICYKVYDGLQHFERHPNEPTTGRAELVWHYDQASELYNLFETKGEKPLNKPFASLVSFYYKDHGWKFDVTVRKTDAE
jgi:hypothetical protein